MLSAAERVIPKVRARFGFGSPSIAKMLRPLSAKMRANVPAIVVLPDPPFPTVAIFIVSSARRGLVALRILKAITPSGAVKLGLEGPTGPAGLVSLGVAARQKPIARGRELAPASDSRCKLGGVT